MKSSDPLSSTKYHMLLRAGIALVIVGGLLVLLAPSSPVTASDRARLDTVEICGGKCVHEEITFETGDLRINRVDVVFLVDASGSMGDEIDEVQGQSEEIMDSVLGLVPDSAFGVASFVDYSEFTDSRYGRKYGSGSDYPYRLDQDITEDMAAVRSGLNRIKLLYGNDTPESYSRALWEMQFMNWRENSKRIVIIFGDAYPHDRTFFDKDYGVDPGRDEIEGTEDDLVFVDVVQALADEKISVIGVNSGYSDTNAVKFFEYVTEETGGIYFQLRDAEDIPEAIARSVEEEVSVIDLLTVRVPEDYADWVVYTPESYTEVGSHTTVKFDVTICPLDGGADDGKYDFDIVLDGDGAVLETVPISIDYERRCTSGPEVFIADNDDDDGTVCSEGPFWNTGDIFNRLADDFKGDDESIPPHQNPLRGQPNYLYAHVHNIGDEDASKVEVTLYWANAGIGLRWPDDWEKIDSVRIDVPQGEEVWTPGIEWDPPGKASGGHICILAIVESDDDPVTREGNVPCDNNLAQRNLNVLDLGPGEGEGTDEVSFEVAAPPEDMMGVIDIVVIIPDAPPDTNVWITMPGDLFDRWEKAGGEVEGGRVKGDRILADQDERETIIRNVPLKPGEEAEFDLEIEARIDKETEPFSVTVVERVDGRDWGGITYYYTPPPPPSFPTSLEDIQKLIEGNLVIVGIALGCCGLAAIGVAVVAIGVVAARRR